MHKRLLVLALVIVICIAGVAYAAVEVKTAGTKVGLSDSFDFYGPAISEDDKDTIIDTRSHTGDFTVSGEIYGVGILTIADDVYLLKGITMDGSLYLTGDNDASDNPIVIRQPDGGCSSCGVDDAGSTFSCHNITCPSGMSQR